MDTTIGPILSTLRDVEGVQGAFVISDEGDLVDKDLPAMFDASLFREVGPRIARLYEAFLSGGDQMDACVVRFHDFKLYVRAMQPGFLCILSSVGVNMPALKMGVQLARRRILAEYGVASDSMSAPPPTVAPRSSAVPSAPIPQMAPDAAPMTYRGRPVR
jgi:predicted regulator of Ras-like GTPase activity (Roadblock/LC7/MglB family)